MQIPQALKILRALADGVDPYTGEVLPETGPYQNPDTIRAIFRAISELEKNWARTREKHLPENAGKPWNEKEYAVLCRGFDARKSITALAALHKRSEGAIRSRLEKHGKITIRSDHQ